MEEVDNIIRILTEARQAFQNNEPYKLKVLSDQTIHSSTIYQDADNIIVAVVVYSLGKLIERENYRRMEGWNELYQIITKNLDNAIKQLQQKDYEKFFNSMGKIRNSINEIDSNLSEYVKDIFYKAGINKAFKLYEHGLSAEKTAYLLGVSLWDLATYIGQTTISESHYNEAISVKERIRLAENIFNSNSKKVILLDAGPLISLALNGLLHTLDLLKSKFPNISFIMTPQVKREIIDKSIKIKKYELEAIKIQTLIEKGTIEFSNEYVPNSNLEKETARILRVSNSTIRAGGENVQIVHEGEASCLAFLTLCKNEKKCGYESIVCIDERVTRLLSESPENLKAIMERKLHSEVILNIKNIKEFKSFKFIRSPELIYLAYKNNLYEYKKDKMLLDALLYSVKYSGATISSKEIEEIKSFS